MTDRLSLQVDADGVAWLTLNRRTDGPPVLDAGVLAELPPIVDDLSRRADLQGLCLHSADPETFCAGADVRWLRELCDGPDPAEAVTALSAAGQACATGIERLGIPTLALIDGACLGGGLELALACQFRLATPTPRVRMGLPEVKLGLVPGIGGTQRLPRVVGLARGLTWMLQGRVVNAHQARRAGLVDGLASATDPLESARQFLRRCAAGQGPRRRPPGWGQRWLEGTRIGRSFVFGRAGRATAGRAHHYPALAAIRQAVQAGCDTPGPAGYAAEAEAIGACAATPVARNLIDLFLTARGAGKDLPDAARPDITHVGVLGAGVMGAGIAHWLASRGLQVPWRDLTAPDCARGMANVAEIVRRARRASHLTDAEASALLHRLAPRTDLRGFRRCGLVIETVVEDVTVKRQALAELEAELPDDAWIATNTSTLPIGTLASALRRPERLLGLHFFNPVRRMDLVEVIAGPRTDPGVADAATAFVRERLGRTPIRVADAPGFCVNRVLAPFLAEAAALAEAGADPAHVDRVLTRFGMEMGPFAILGLVGLWTARKAATVLRAAFGTRHAPNRLLDFADPAHMDLASLRRAAAASARAGDVPQRPHIGDAEILERCLLALVNEAGWVLHERVVADDDTLDLAMVFGTGFAPWTGGPMRWAAAEGLANVAERLRQCARLFGDRFTPAPTLG